MKSNNFQTTIEDLKALFIHSRCAYPGLTFNQWLDEVEKAYESYVFNYYNETKKVPKTYCEWINGQIIALTS